MEEVDSTDDPAYVTSLEQRVFDLENSLLKAEFLLRLLGINWKEAGRMSDSAIRLADDIRDLLCKASQ